MCYEGIEKMIGGFQPSESISVVAALFCILGGQMWG